MHHYLISYAIAVNGFPGTGHTDVVLAHPLAPGDIAPIMAGIQADAKRIDPRASMPNVVFIWKFEG